MSMVYEWSITQNQMDWFYNPFVSNPDPSRTLMKCSIWKKYGKINYLGIETDELYDIIWYRYVVGNELNNDNVFFSTELSNHLVDKVSTRHNGLLSESDWDKFDSMISMPSINSWINIDAFGVLESKRCIELPTELAKQIYPIIREYYKTHPLE